MSPHQLQVVIMMRAQLYVEQLTWGMIREIIWKMISVPQLGKNVVVGEVWDSGWERGSGKKPVPAVLPG